MGRKPTYDQDAHKKAIIEWIAEGKSLRSYCEKEGAPKLTTVLFGRRRIKSLPSNTHTRAKLLQSFTSTNSTK